MLTSFQASTPTLRLMFIKLLRCLLQAANISKRGSYGSRRDLLGIVCNLLQSRVIVEGTVKPPDKALPAKVNARACVCSGERVVGGGEYETKDGEQSSF